jgi:hypothetical protein
LDIEDDDRCEGPLAGCMWQCPYCGHGWVSEENYARCPSCKRLFADDEPDTVPQNKILTNRREKMSRLDNMTDDDLTRLVAGGQGRSAGDVIAAAWIVGTAIILAAGLIGISILIGG